MMPITAAASRKFLVYTIVAAVLSLVSAGIAMALFFTAVRKQDPKVAPVFLVWLVVSYALSSILALLAASVYRNRPKKTQTANTQEDTPLQDLRRDSNPDVSTHRNSNSSSLPYPLPHLNVRGRMTGQDYQPKHTSNDATAADDLAIMPCTTNVPKSPFTNHPNPLAMSPVSAGPPPTFPSAALLRAQTSAYSGFSNHSGATMSTTHTGNMRDPFNNSALEIKTASSISLTSIQARQVVAVARSDSLKKIRAATARGEGEVYHAI